MSNVLSEEKKQQVISLGKLGWSLRRIEEATGVRRETASAYLKAAGVVVCLPGWGRRAPAKPAIEVTTDFCAVFSRNPEPPKRPKLSPSTCEPCIATSSISKSRSNQNEPDRAKSCLATATSRWHRCGAGNAPAASPSGTDGTHRLPVLSGVGRTAAARRPTAGASPKAGPVS
jgi:hypothetical protein